MSAKPGGTSPDLVCVGGALEAVARRRSAAVLDTQHPHPFEAALIDHAELSAHDRRGVGPHEGPPTLSLRQDRGALNLRLTAHPCDPQRRKRADDLRLARIKRRRRVRVCARRSLGRR